MKAKYALVIVLAIAIGVLVGMGSRRGPPSAPPAPDQLTQPPAGAFQLGFAYNSLESLANFIELTKQAGSVLAWDGDWFDGATTQGAPYVLTDVARANGLTPRIVFQFLTQVDGQLLRPLNDTNKAAYKAIAVAYAEKYKPKYLGLGIDVNTLYEKSPADFSAFAAFYDEVYKAVKAMSPSTKIFTMFQLEAIKGQSGLFGPRTATWRLIDQFRLDAIGFTTYPGLVFKSPSEIPGDYYEEISRYTDKPILFTEVGCSSKPMHPGWDPSTDEKVQAEFVARFFALTTKVTKEVVVWSFLHDLPSNFGIFQYMGLIDTAGTKKPAWDVWTRNK